MPASGGPLNLSELAVFIRADYAAAGGRGNPLNPAIWVPAVFRVSQLLWRTGLRPLAKLLEWALVSTVSSQLSPSASVGRGLSLPHPIGIVLGSRTTIGENVTLQQNITLGSNFKRARGEQRQPVLGDRVRVSPGAVVAGPVVVGADAVIGANTVITIDVPAGHVARPHRPEFTPRSQTSVGPSPDR